MWHPFYYNLYKKVLGPSESEPDSELEQEQEPRPETPKTTTTATTTSTSISFQPPRQTSPAGEQRPYLPSIRTFSTLSPIQSVSSPSPIPSLSCTSSPALSLPPASPIDSPASTISPLLSRFPAPASQKEKEKPKAKAKDPESTDEFADNARDTDADAHRDREDIFQLPHNPKKLPGHLIPLPSAAIAAATLASAFSSFPANPHVPRTTEYHAPAPGVNVPRRATTTTSERQRKKTTTKTYEFLVKAHILSHGLVVSTGGDERNPTHDAVALLLPPGADPRSSARRARNWTKGWGWRVYVRSGMWRGAARRWLGLFRDKGGYEGTRTGEKRGSGEEGEGEGFEGIHLDTDLRWMKARMAGVMGFQAEETWMLTGLGAKVGSRPFGLGGRAVEVCCDMVDAREKPLYTECFEYNVRFFEKYGFRKVGMVAMDPVEKGVILSMMVREPDLRRFQDSGEHAVDDVFASF
ncbi:hypothetical protein BJY01DRAFT_245492 [Aspergillus pseudoustus]|uniref:N-acetyltransferase domain-containing protein n=1 Tax=Aspergillus pseudoustus TaxID=1810923 RepID=A0ABR4KER4_9EURO